MNTEVLKFIAQAAIALSGAFLAAYLSARRFRSEKWWERKAAAYAELVEALHQMKWPSSEHIDAEIEGRQVPENERQEYWEQFKVARRNVWRIADSSSFLVSPRVLEAVQAMEREIGKASNAESWFEAQDVEYSAVQTCLNAVKELGRAELGIKNA